MNEPKLRLLGLEEVKGANRLSVIKTRGALANPTDFANKEGCLWQTYIKDNYEVDKKGNKRHYRTREYICGNYYLEKQDRDERILKSIGEMRIDKKRYPDWEAEELKRFNKESKETFDEYMADNEKVIAIGYSGLDASIADQEILIIKERRRKHDREIGIRLAMQYDSIDSIPNNGRPPVRADDGVLEVEYGYLPNRQVEGKEYDKLKKAEAKGKLIETPYTYTIDDRKIKIDEGTEVIPNEKKVYMYDGKLYMKFDYTACIDSGLGYKYVIREGFCEIEPVKWLVDLEAKTMITKDVVWGGAEYDNIKIIIQNLEKEMFQIKERNILNEENSKKGFLYNLFHKKDKIKALPEGTYQMEQGKPNEEQEVSTEITKSENTDVNDFQESIRKAAQSDIEESWKAAKVETKETEEPQKVNPVEEKVNNILDAQINRNDEEKQPQYQYYAKPQSVRTDRTYYVKGEGGELYPTVDSNNSDYYIGLDGVLRPTKEPIENHHGDSIPTNNQYVAKITADYLLKKPEKKKVDLSKPPYEPKGKRTNLEEQDDGNER